MLWTFLRGFSPVTYLCGVLLVVCIGLTVKIKYLEHNRDKWRDRAETATLAVDTIADINVGNLQITRDISRQLDLCVLNNQALEQRGKDAVKDLEGKLVDSNIRIEEEKNRVREALKDEDCSIVPIPSDLERMFRNTNSNN